jgi:hypothetical protein
VRVAASRPDAFRRCREALALHHGAGWPVEQGPLGRTSWVAERVAAHARFLELHGALLGVDLEHFVPELQQTDGTLDEAAARLLLALVTAYGTDWLVTEWMNGGLAPLWAGGAVRTLSAEVAAARASAAGLTEHVTRVEEAHAEHAARLEEARQGDIAARVADRVVLDAIIDDLHRAAAARHDELYALAAEHDALRANAAFLQTRHETLLRVESGGWWRLRGHLQRATRLAAAVRRRGSR